MGLILNRRFPHPFNTPSMGVLTMILSELNREANKKIGAGLLIHF